MPTAIVKPTHDCNLACKYCYVPENAEQGTMDDKALANTIEKFTLFNGKERHDGNKIESHFIWHGGEPLLMGLPFFQKVVEIEKPLRDAGYCITNGIQSNGTLINEDFLDFLEEQNDFNVGLSLDGPQEMHDAIRPYNDGSGSFKDVYRTVKLFQKRNEKLKKEGKKIYLGGGVICILNRLNIDRIEELYKFFHEENISVKVNPLIKSGRAVPIYKDISINPKEFGEAMIKLFEIWFYDHKQRIDIDPFDLLMGNIMTKVPHGCQYGESCQNHFISIGPTGAVYPCGRFDGTPEFYLGNINEQSIEEINKHPVKEQFKKRSYETVKGCEPCEYKDICNSGCAHNAYMIRGNIMDRDYYCAGEKMLFKHIEDALHKELKKAEVVEV
jgi:uncharacterized protein